MKHAWSAALVLGSLCAWPMPAAPAANGEVVVFSRMHVTPGREAEAEARLVQQMEYVQQALPGITYRYYRGTRTPGLFVTYEVFPDRDTARRVLDEILPEFRQKFGTASEGLLAQPVEIEVVKPVGD